MKNLKWMRVILSLLMCIAMIMPAGTAMKAQAEERPTSGTCGESVTWALDAVTGVLTVSGSGPMNNYTSVFTNHYETDSPFYRLGESIKKIEVEVGVTTIGNAAFPNCNSLTCVTIPNSVTSIGDDAFHNCDSLTNVTIPDSVTSIGKSAFSSCSGLTNVTIPNGVTTIERGTFHDCSSLSSVIIPESVTTISRNAFSCCRSLTSVTIPSNVTTIEEETFYECSGLTGVTIPDGVTIIGKKAFYECSKLTSVTVPNSLAKIDSQAFNFCTGLETIVLHGVEKTAADFNIEGGNDAFKNAKFVTHDETSAITKEPTKDAPGTRTYTCTICGKQRTEEIPALGGNSTPDSQPDKPSSDSPFAEDFSPAMIEEPIVYPNTTEDPSTLNCKFYHQNGKSYWYESGVRQGTYDDPKGVIGDGTVRGREVCDMETAAWYWCDSVYNGAKAINKEVWMPYIYQTEKSWDDAEIKQNAEASKDEHADMSAQLERDIKAHTGKWVRYNANGKMFKGWYKVTSSEAQYYPDQVGNIYYYDPKTGLMAKGDLTIDGVSYHFDDTTGVLKR